jgi:K(+)-stimulated pyrophosphate-energized sodium pump
VIGILAVTLREGDRTALTAINRGFFAAALLSAGLVAVAAFRYLPSKLHHTEPCQCSGQSAGR